MKRTKNQLLAVGLMLSFAAFGKAATVYGGTTTVDLNGNTVNALVGLGFSIAPIAPATLTGLDAVFPITGGTTTTDITHSGGLAFTKGGVTTDISDFEINLLNDTITGNVNSATGSTTTFFDIGAGDTLTLDATLAGALSSIYGVPNLTGASIGTATVAAVTTPEPGSLALAGLGIVAAGILSRRRSRA